MKCYFCDNQSKKEYGTLESLGIFIRQDNNLKFVCDDCLKNVLRGLEGFNKSFIFSSLPLSNKEELFNKLLNILKGE